MARIDVDVEIELYLDEVRSGDLIEELISRDLDNEEIGVFLEAFQQDSYKGKPSIIDDMKFNLISQGIKTKTLDELQVFFK